MYSISLLQEKNVLEFLGYSEKRPRGLMKSLLEPAGNPEVSRSSNENLPY